MELAFLLVLFIWVFHFLRKCNSQIWIVLDLFEDLVVDGVEVSRFGPGA